MCGIIGFARDENIVPKLTAGLEKLEYRDYDSAGLAVTEDNKIKTVKTVGRVAALKAEVERTGLTSFTGIAHTRWATNGKPSEANAHPHISEDGMFAVVHNGIIENAAGLKAELQKDGIIFKSETDTEVIAQLLMRNYSGKLIECISKTVNALKGSFALGILCGDFPNAIAAVKYLSPLTVGRDKRGFMIASDSSALIGCADECYTPDDGEIAIITRQSAKFYTFSGREIKKNPCPPDGEEFTSVKNGFDHFMLSEIYAQPEAVRRTLAAYIADNKISFNFAEETNRKLQNIDRIIFTACGSAWHAGQAARLFYEKILNIPCEAVLASELRYISTPIDEKTLVIAISQSGETADTLEAVRKSNRLKAVTVGIVNVRASYIAKECGSVIYTLAGRETAVATTKGYTTQLAALYAFALYLAGLKDALNAAELDVMTSQLTKCSEKIALALQTAPNDEKIARTLINENSIFFIGRGADYACALEASLKMKEITYIHSECCAAGELKHGTISLIEPGTRVFALACCESTADKTLNNINEVISRGADVICCTTERLSAKFAPVCKVITVPDTDELFSPIVQVVPFQLISYYTALKKGCDIDKPRNLAKSVTVE